MFSERRNQNLSLCIMLEIPVMNPSSLDRDFFSSAMAEKTVLNSVICNYL